MKNLGFEFYVGGLENAICKLLLDGDPFLELAGLKSLGCKEVRAYSGELDSSDDVLKAVQVIAPRFPLALVSYGSGISTRNTAINLLDGEPIEEEHKCSFVVIVASRDLRGDEARRRGAGGSAGIYPMIDRTIQLIGGAVFEADFERDGVVVREPLNHQPLLPTTIEAIVNRKDLAAYAVPFETSFKYWLPDRRPVFAGTADEIRLGIVPKEAAGAAPTVSKSNLPGVHGEKN